MDLGLLGGLAEGLTKGVDAYNESKERQLRRRQMAASLMEKGINEDSSGGLSFSPEMQKKKQLEAAQTDYQLGELDPNSEQSKAVNSLTSGLIKQVAPDANVPEDMSAYGINRLGTNSLASHALTASGAAQRANLVNDRFTKTFEARNALSQDKFAQQQVDRYGKQQKQNEGTLAAATRASHIMDEIKSGGLKSTPTLMTDLNGTLASMFAGGAKPTVYGMSHQEQQSLYNRMQKAMAYVTSDSLDTMPEAQLDQLHKDINALQQSYQIQHERTFKQFQASAPDNAKPLIEENYKTFRNQYGLPVDSSQNQQQGAAPGGGLIGKQVRIKYQGKDLMIPESDLQQAVKDGAIPVN